MTDTAVPQQSLPLTAVYQGWGDFQSELVKITTPLTPEQLALPVAPQHWSLGQAIAHIAADRTWWFHQWMNEGGAEVLPYLNWFDESQPARTPAELATALKATWVMVEGALARYTVSDLGHVFPQPPTLTEAERKMFGPITLQEIIWHVYGHERHHAGELATGLGWHNLPTLSGW